VCATLRSISKIHEAGLASSLATLWCKVPICSSSSRMFAAPAPDIAGKNIANPLATILSAAMMLRFSLNMASEAERIENAVQKVLAQGYRTADIDTAGMKRVSTSEMGDAVVAALG
ncbi:MAG: hypothetical protein EBW77_03630, partial [Burkholderiaceae bacterium]|nr:hypothetical protein [Burkholderiaceae bacterium]